MRLCLVGEELASRGHAWYVGDASNVPGLAAESLIIKIGENVARLSAEVLVTHPEVSWSAIALARSAGSQLRRNRLWSGLGHARCRPADGAGLYRVCGRPLDWTSPPGVSARPLPA